jgi:hypothetical protein
VSGAHFARGPSYIGVLGKREQCRMKVEVVCNPDCPNVTEARAQLLRAFAEAGISPGWIEWNRKSAAAPSYARAFGAPTVLVNGRDGGRDMHVRECLLSPVS